MATQLETASAVDQLWDRWPYLTHEQRLKQFRELHTGEKADFFLAVSGHDQLFLLLSLPQEQRHVWMRLLAPDDAVDVIQEAGPELREDLRALLDEPTRKEVIALLAYREDDAGGLMNPRFARLRPDTTVDVAISYLRKEAPSVVQLYYAYFLDQDQHLGQFNPSARRSIWACSNMTIRSQEICRTTSTTTSGMRSRHSPDTGRLLAPRCANLSHGFQPTISSETK